MLALDDKIKKKGLSKEDIVRYTFTQTLKKSDIEKFTNKECVICMDEFKPKQKIIRLPCLCVFHAKCITRHFKASIKCTVLSPP
jgi:hypothetical protein